MNKKEPNKRDVLMWSIVHVFGSKVKTNAILKLDVKSGVGLSKKSKGFLKCEDLKRKTLF